MADEKPRHQVLLRTLIFVFKGDQLLLMRYSGKGTNLSKEKSDRKDYYNPIGGHVEKGEDIIESAKKEAQEEVGIILADPKIKGIIHVDGFAGKNMVNFIIAGTTGDEPIKSSLEGDLEWVNKDDVPNLNVFKDIGPILNELLSMKPGEIFTGVAKFEGFDLKELDINVI